MKMAEKFFDITPKISSRLGVFPGDQAFTRNVNLSFSQGENLEVSSITTTVHLGAHADAPSHYHVQGQTIEKRSLGPYMGLCQLIRIENLKSGERVMPEHLGNMSIAAPRILIDTKSFPNPENWNSEFNSFSPELLEFLSAKGVKLVGIDTPSVDPESSKALESHQVLYAKNLSVLEGLLLKDVPEGVYTLIALPLPIENGDASPVRAILLPCIPEFPEFK
jgi:arylformamidase